MKKGLVIAASLGNCVHVAGALHFLTLAADEGFETWFLGPATPVERIIAAIKERSPVMVSVGYRLTPENGEALLLDLVEQAKQLVKQPRWVFGGTRPVAAKAAALGFFEKVFDGSEDIDETIAFLRGKEVMAGEARYAQSLGQRIAEKQPYPLLRHHFGLPNVEETRRGIETIAKSKVLDVISLGPDQNTQQFFFEPEKRRPELDGAGGVPIRTAEQFRALKAAAQCGNFPLMRCYSGTAHVFEMAQLLDSTIDNAWCAVPLCWYNELDGRGDRSLETSMAQAVALMGWHGERGIPVEVNEPHHWGLRDAHDTISVVMAYLAAYHAKKAGVKEYISQHMFNNPSNLSFSMDLARVLAQVELVESLADGEFTVYRQARAGLPFLSSDLEMAKGQLAASTYLSMAISPHIIHVVGYSEAEHAATPQVVIESCKIVRGVIRSVLNGGVDQAADDAVKQRKAELLQEAQVLLAFIKERYTGVDDPLGSVEVLCDCIQEGIIDAPHIVKNEKFRGTLKTRVIGGKCLAYDEKAGHPLCERERLAQWKGEKRYVKTEDSGDQHWQRRPGNGSILRRQRVSGEPVRPGAGAR